MGDDIWPEEIGVPTWLETPSTGVGATLPTVSRPQLLPLNDLTWENFDRLCLRYVRGRANVVRSQLYGIKGQSQHGIDLYARFTEPFRYEVYQCKKLSQLTGGDIQHAVDRFLDGKWRAESKSFRIMTSHGIEDTKIAESIEAAGKRLELLGIDFEVLGASQISKWLKGQPRLVDDFLADHGSKRSVESMLSKGLENALMLWKWLIIVENLRDFMRFCSVNTIPEYRFHEDRRSRNSIKGRFVIPRCTDLWEVICPSASLPARTTDRGK